MLNYVIFSEGQIKMKNGRWKYEPNTRYRITKEDDQYYYIGSDKFYKLNQKYEIGNIVNDNIKCHEE